MRSVLPAFLLVLIVLPAFADRRSGARSTDAVAKEWIDEFEAIAKSRKKTLENEARQFKILKDLEFGPCKTAQRFLLKLMKKRSASGDHRLYAMGSLLEMSDRKTLDELIAALGKAKDPTLWLAFGDALSQVRAGNIRSWISGDGLAARKPEVVAACLDALLRRPNKESASDIQALYRKHARKGDADLAHRALKALVRVSAASAAPFVLEAATHEDVRVRLAAADLLPRQNPLDENVVRALRTLLQDDVASVRQTAARGIGAAKRKEFVPGLTALLQDAHLRTRLVATDALKAIGETLPEGLTLPSYHGLPIDSDRVVFLVDGSSSMTWPWRKEIHRVDVARTELATVLGAIPTATLFNVIVFSDKPAFWKKEEVTATGANTKAALAWAEKQLATPSGDTHLYEALEAAFARNPAFDTMYLLTDGNPTAGRYYTLAGLKAAVRAMNRYRRVTLHTIGLSLSGEDPGMPNLAEDLPLMKQILETLAKTTHGRFREVTKAPR